MAFLALFPFPSGCTSAASPNAGVFEALASAFDGSIGGLRPACLDIDLDLGFGLETPPPPARVLAMETGRLRPAGFLGLNLSVS